MKKKIIFLLIAMSTMAAAWTQTLFTYGDRTVDAKEFLRAFNKNNTVKPANKAKAIKDYLNLYIASRLKIREAYARGYDTLPQMRDELANLRSQITETFINDPEAVNTLVNEAFRRSQKDIHLAHIFVSLRNHAGTTDTLAARKKIEEAHRQLKAGKDFSAVAELYSEDPSAKKNKGDIGFITVFTLPYDFENIVYNLPVNKYSGIYRSRNGYHIIRNLGERKALGRIKAGQILLAIPPGSTDAVKQQIAKRADSLYKRLVAGDDFAKLAESFSNDYISAAAGGIVPEFSVGQYDPLFEKTIISLPRNGSISKPFQTAHGWHIVKRIAVTPVPASPNNKEYMDLLRQRVQQSDRIGSTEKTIAQKVLRTGGFRKMDYTNEQLWAISDSLMDFRRMTMPVRLTRESPLFKLGDRVLTVQDWINYALTWRYRQDGTGMKSYDVIWDEFIQATAMSYYREHLEDFNEEFRHQVNEFRDGNLFFEIMQREIWGRSQADTSALKDFYEKNRANYKWGKSADAILFFAADEETARLAHAQVTKTPSAWRSIAAALGEKLILDSSRYEWTQIPGTNKPAILKKGMITSPLVNKNDNSAAFGYILEVYTQPAQRSFAEARGLVINDYQSWLEHNWLLQLQEKYPVKIDMKVLERISK